MCKLSNQVGFTGLAERRRVRANWKWFGGLLVLTLLMALCPARADDPDDQYLQIYGLIQRADDLNTSGKAAAAKAKYLEAHSELKRFQQTYPEWNAKLVSYRLNYIVQKLVAMSEKPRTVAGDVPATNAPAQPESKAATATSAQPVKLLVAGAEPRKVLRLHPNPGDKQTLSLTMKMAMQTKAGEMQSQAIKLPPIKITLEATVKGVADNGDITCEMVMGDVAVSDEPGTAPEVAEAVKAAFAGVKGLSGSGTISSRGFNQGLEFKAPPGSNPQASQVIDQMKDFYTQLSAPLPEEAVGAGAKWEVKMPIKAQGMTMDQTATYEVVTLEAERLTTKSTIAQHAANQKIQNPAMGGLTMDLTKMTGNGTGERTFDLTKLLPTAGSGEVHSETSMAMNMGGQKQAMTMKMDMNIRFEAK